MTPPNIMHAVTRAAAALLVLPLFSLSPSLPACAQDSPDKRAITVEMSGFRNDRGHARVCLFDGEKGFPLMQEQAIRAVTAGIAGNRARVVLGDVPPGSYAVSVLHDENGNGRMDTNTVGIPKEGAGASNNPKPLGPPDFEDARFIVTGGSITVQVTVRYP